MTQSPNTAYKPLSMVVSIAAVLTLVFYGLPFLKHYASGFGSHVLDWAFLPEEGLNDPFLRNDVAAPPHRKIITRTKTNKSPIKKLSFTGDSTLFGPLESRKKFTVKERSYGTLWVIAKNSAAHQFECSLESSVPDAVKLSVSTFEQGCEVHYNVGKPSQKSFGLDILVENKSGVRLLSENEIAVIPRKAKPVY